MALSSAPKKGVRKLCSRLLFPGVRKPGCVWLGLPKGLLLLTNDGLCLFSDNAYPGGVVGFGTHDGSPQGDLCHRASEQKIMLPQQSWCILSSRHYIGEDEWAGGSVI